MTPPADVSSYSVEDGVAVLAIHSPPVNALGNKVRIALHEGIVRAIDDKNALAVVLI